MIEYQMTLKQEIKIQPLLVFLFNKRKIVAAIFSALISMVGFVLSNMASAIFAIPSVILLLFSGYIFMYWMSQARIRSRKMTNLYRSQETKLLTYSLSERDGVIRDYCNELKTASEWKRSTIKNVFAVHDTLFVTFFSGSISVYPNTESIRKFFKG